MFKQILDSSKHCSLASSCGRNLREDVAASRPDPTPKSVMAADSVLSLCVVSQMQLSENRKRLASAIGPDRERRERLGKGVGVCGEKHQRQGLVLRFLSHACREP